MDDGDGFRVGIPRSAVSMCRAGQRGLQLDDSPPDPLPNGLPFEVAALRHQVGAPGRSKLGIVTILPDQQVGGSPDARSESLVRKDAKACPVGCPPDAIRLSRD